MYPKTFYKTIICTKTKPGTCFLIMPFEKAFDPVHKAIESALERPRLGMTCTRTDKLRGGGHIIEDILRGIGESEVVLADITGQRANVFYELGIAHMCKDSKNVILLCQKKDEVPFDLKQIRYIVYSKTVEGLKKLQRDLEKAISSVARPAYQIVVDAAGKGVLAKEIMGRDKCLYKFEIPKVWPAAKAAKFHLRVTRLKVVKGKAKSHVVFDDGCGLQEGGSRIIRDTDWMIRLISVTGRRPVFRIQQA